MKVGLLVVAAAGLLGGCSSTRDETLWNPAPPEMGPTTTTDEVNNGMSHTNNTNWRLFWDDMGRFWLFDRPSRLTPYPVK